MIEKNSGRNASPAPPSLHAEAGNSMRKEWRRVIGYLLFVIGGREEEASDHWSE
jgi:hypothetical protein